MKNKDVNITFDVILKNDSQNDFLLRNSFNSYNSALDDIYTIFGEIVKIGGIKNEYIEEIINDIKFNDDTEIHIPSNYKLKKDKIITNIIKTKNSFGKGTILGIEFSNGDKITLILEIYYYEINKLMNINHRCLDESIKTKNTKDIKNNFRLVDYSISSNKLNDYSILGVFDNGEDLENAIKEYISELPKGYTYIHDNKGIIIRDNKGNKESIITYFSRIPKNK